MAVAPGLAQRPGVRPLSQSGKAVDLTVRDRRAGWEVQTAESVRVVYVAVSFCYALLRLSFRR